jgi:hypothetical protein
MAKARATGEPNITEVRRVCKRWSHNEDMIIITNYEKNGASISSELPGRSVPAIHNRAVLLGVHVLHDVRSAYSAQAARLVKNHVSMPGKDNPNYTCGKYVGRYHYVKKDHEKSPEKYTARNRVAEALRKGVLTRLPCAICGCTKSEAHHKDYSKVLDVTWLCRKHHSEEHRK